MTVFVTKPDPYIRRCHHLKNSFTNDARQGDCAFASYPEQCYKKTAENCIGNGPQETSVNITAKTPAAPAPPQAPDQPSDKYDALDIIHIHTKMYLDPKDDVMHDATDSDYISDDKATAPLRFLIPHTPQPRRESEPPWNTLKKLRKKKTARCSSSTDTTPSTSSTVVPVITS